MCMACARYVHGMCICVHVHGCTSTIGTTLPVAAAPTAAAPIQASLIGVSRTRCPPNSWLGLGVGCSC